MGWHDSHSPPPCKVHPGTPSPSPGSHSPAPGTAPSHIPPDCTAPGEAPRQLTGSEIKAYCYLFPDKFNSGPVNLDRTVNCHRAGPRLSERLGFGMGTLQLGAYLSKFPLSPSLPFTPLPTFSDLYHLKKGQRFALLVCCWSTPWLGWYKQTRCRQGLNLTESARWFSDHIPDWLSGSKGNRIYCTEMQQQQQPPVRSLRSFMHRNKNFRAAWRYEIFLNYFLFQHSLRILLLLLFLGLVW